MPAEPDADVLRGFVRGDQGAFEQLFRRFEADVFRWILRILRDSAAAEDVLVDAFWRAYRGRAQFDAGRSFGAWIRRIATNAALDHLRAHKPTRGWQTADNSLPVARGPDRETNDAIALAFRRLRSRCSRNSRTRTSRTRWAFPRERSNRACFERRAR
jgi:RNA polymerase sigma factor (sigma-70 family)